MVLCFRFTFESESCEIFENDVVILVSVTTRPIPGVGTIPTETNHIVSFEQTRYINGWNDLRVELYEVGVDRYAVFVHLNVQGGCQGATGRWGLFTRLWVHQNEWQFSHQVPVRRQSDIN